MTLRELLCLLRDVGVYGAAGIGYRVFCPGANEEGCIFEFDKRGDCPILSMFRGSRLWAPRSDYLDLEIASEGFGPKRTADLWASCAKKCAPNFSDTFVFVQVERMVGEFPERLLVRIYPYQTGMHPRVEFPER